VNDENTIQSLKRQRLSPLPTSQSEIGSSADDHAVPLYKKVCLHDPPLRIELLYENVLIFLVKLLFRTTSCIGSCNSSLAWAEPSPYMEADL
jgi:hypothetical protein